MGNQPLASGTDAERPNPPPSDHWGGPVDDRITKPVFIEEQERYVNNLLSATNDIKNSINELTKEIPHYTKIITDFQERFLKTTKQFTDSYFESQKEIIRIYQPIWDKMMYNAVGSLYRYNNWCGPPRDR